MGGMGGRGGGYGGGFDSLWHRRDRGHRHLRGHPGDGTEVMGWRVDAWGGGRPWGDGRPWGTHLLAGFARLSGGPSGTGQTLRGERGERWGRGYGTRRGGGRRWHRCRHAGSSPHLEAGRSGGTLLTSLSSGTLRGKWGGRGVREGGSGGGGAPVASVVRGEGGYGYSQWGRGDPEHRLHRPYRQHPAGGGGLRALRAPLGAGSAWG